MISMVAKEEKNVVVSGATQWPYIQYSRSERTETVTYVHLYYPLQMLADEIEMHTATIGKHRGSEASSNLLDLVTLTRDEFPQFASYARTAMYRVFRSLSRFCKDIKDCYKFDEGCFPVIIDTKSEVTIRYRKDDYVFVDGTLYVATADGDSTSLSALVKPLADFRRSIHYVLKCSGELREGYVPALDQAVFDALKWYIIALWFHNTLPNTNDEKYYQEQAMAAADDVSRTASSAISGTGGIVNKAPRIF